MGHSSRACTPSLGGSQSSTQPVAQRRGWWPLRLGPASSTANQEERLRAAQFERFLLGPEPSTPATDANVQLFEVKFLRPTVRGGEPESFLRVTHLPSGKVWQTRRSLDDWLRLEDAVEAEAQALDTLREQSEERSLPPGELPRTLADALEAAGLHPFEPPPAKEVLRARRDVPLRKVLEDVRARLYELLQDEELGRCGTLQRFLGVRSPEMPSQVLIKRLQETVGEAMVEAELEVTMCTSEEEANDGQPWAAATHVVAAVSGMVHSQGRHEKFEFEPWFSNVVPLASPENHVRIGFHGLRHDVAVEFEVRSVNAVGYSAPVLIRTFTPLPSQSAETSSASEAQAVAPALQRWTPHQSTSADSSIALNSKEAAQAHRQQGAEFLGIDIGTVPEELERPVVASVQAAPDESFQPEELSLGSSAASAAVASEVDVYEESVAAPKAQDADLAEMVNNQQGTSDAAREPTAPESEVPESNDFEDLQTEDLVPKRETSKASAEFAESSTGAYPAGKLQASSASAQHDAFEEPEEDFVDACSTWSKEEPEDISQSCSLPGPPVFQGQLDPKAPEIEAPETQAPETEALDAQASAAAQMRAKLAARRNSDDFLEDEPERTSHEGSSAAVSPGVGEAVHASAAENAPVAASVEGIGGAFDDCQKLLSTLDLHSAEHRERQSKDHELPASRECASDAEAVEVTVANSAGERETADASALEATAEERQLADLADSAAVAESDLGGAAVSSSFVSDSVAGPGSKDADAPDASASTSEAAGTAAAPRRIDVDSGSPADPSAGMASSETGSSAADTVAGVRIDDASSGAVETAQVSRVTDEHPEAGAPSAASTVASSSPKTGSTPSTAPPPPAPAGEAVSAKQAPSADEPAEPAESPAEASGAPVSADHGCSAPDATTEQVASPVAAAVASASSAPAVHSQAAYPAGSAKSQIAQAEKAAYAQRPAVEAPASTSTAATAAGGPPAGGAMSSAAPAPNTTAASTVAASSAEANRTQAHTPAQREPTPLQPGCVLVAGFQVKQRLLPTEENQPCDVTALERSTEQAQRRIGQLTPISKQQALRMLMGLNMDIKQVAEKARAVAAWRQQNRLDEIQQSLRAQLAASRSAKVQLPHSDTLQKMMAVDACSLVTPDGCPVSVWHVGTANTSEAASISTEELVVWSCAFFEYVDLWISDVSEATGCLAGHIQVFNLEGLNFWHVSNTALINKLKAALGAGGNYVEAVSHIYVINSGRMFSMAWKIVQGLISPRTAGKITVANDVPKELLQALGERSAKRLPAILRASRPAPVLRPPDCTAGAVAPG